MANDHAHGHGHGHGQNREYDLIVRQEPKQARMCGVGTKGANAVLRNVFFFSFLLSFYSFYLINLNCLKTGMDNMLKDDRRPYAFL